MPRTTREQTNPIIESAVAQLRDDLGSIVGLVESGEEPQIVYEAIIEAAVNTPGVGAAAIYTASDAATDRFNLKAASSAFPEAEGEEILRRDESLPPSVRHYDLVCLGAPVGFLLIITIDQEAADRMAPRLRALAHHAAVVFERARLSQTLQHYLDRIQVFNELNQLIVGKVGLPRLVRSLTRDAAFRFGAEFAFTFMLSEDRAFVAPEGVFGCPPDALPRTLPSDEGLMGQVLRLGGHLSIADLSKFAAHGMPILRELGVTSVEVCCLEVHGEILGVILLGYRVPIVLTPNDLTRFEEFCQGAAVAISNAQNQERLRQHTEHLAELVESRTKDLQIQSKLAEEANQAKSRFLANMSHELRTPLTAIVGYGSILTDGIFGPLNDKQSDALNAIVRSSEHLKSLIDDVLNLARIESGKETAEPTRIQLGDVLHQAHKLMLQQAINKGLTLKPLEIDEQTLAEALFVDQKHVNQIVINLMSNAVKYTPAGGSVWLTATVSGDKIRIAIHDTGVGLSAQKMERLFERFERGEDTYSKHQEGTGIGLNLTKHLVELNGGRIGVESELGKGSTFWLLLPRAEASQVVASEQDTKSHAVRLDGLRALVVDDNRDTLAVLRTVLEAAGAQIQTASCVAEAREEFAKSKFDIVLTDMAMPGESGLALISHIRNQTSASQAGIPIIVLSACAFENDKQTALETGASLFLPKPFRPSEIVRGVRQATLATAMRSQVVRMPDVSQDKQ